MNKELKTILKKLDEEYFLLGTTLDGDELTLDTEKLKSFLTTQITELLQVLISDLEEEKKELPRQINMTPFPEDLIKAFRVKDQGFNEGLNLAQERIRAKLK